MKHLTLLASALSFVWVLGCDSGPAQLPTAKVKGTFYIDDKPFGPCRLALDPADPPADPAEKAKNRGASAEVAADGTFVLRTYGKDDGAVPGSYFVTIAPASSAKDPSAMLNPLPGIKVTKVTIPKEGHPNGFDLKCEGTGTSATIGASKVQKAE